MAGAGRPWHCPGERGFQGRWMLSSDEAQTFWAIAASPCPRCGGAVVQHWDRDESGLEHGPDYDSGVIRETETAGCPACGAVLAERQREIIVPSTDPHGGEGEWRYVFYG